VSAFIIGEFMITTIDELIKFVTESLKIAGNVKGVQFSEDLAVTTFVADTKNNVITSAYTGNNNNRLIVNALIKEHIKEMEKGKELDIN
jgi:hypothetical protein